MTNFHETLPDIYYALIVDGEVASNFKNCVALESINAAFQSDPTIVLNNTLNENFHSYDFIVDNEVAHVQRIPKSDEMINAIFQSNPTVVQLTDEQLEMGVGPGWFWNGTEFTETPQ